MEVQRVESSSSTANFFFLKVIMAGTDLFFSKAVMTKNLGETLGGSMDLLT
jgi:hypothetical protein